MKLCGVCGTGGIALDTTSMWERGKREPICRACYDWLLQLPAIRRRVAIKADRFGPYFPVPALERAAS